MESSRSRGTRTSLFYRDLASPISSAHRAAGRLPSPDPAAATPALRRDGGASSISDPPPPPFFTLEDRIDFSSEPGPPSDAPGTPRMPPLRGTPPTSSSPLQSSWGEKGGAGSEAALASSSWWSPVRSADEMGKGSPVDGVVQSGPLMLQPPQGEVVAPTEDRDAAMVEERFDGGEWVTVYGFPPAEANLVIREFEKYGAILYQIAGSRDANWIHILYQSRYDARKVLARHAVQINNVLMVGVKQVDPWQQQILTEKVSGGSSSSNITRTSGFMVSTRPYDLQKSKVAIGTGGSSESGVHSAGTVALPSRSVVSKLVDLVFGI